MRKSTAAIALVGALGLSSLVAGAAGAASFTLASDVAFSSTNTSGSLLAVDAADLGGLLQCPAGSCDDTTQDFLFFQVEMTVGGLEQATVSFSPPPFPVPTWDGAGFLDGSGSEPSVSILNDTQAVYAWGNLTGTSEVLLATNMSDLGAGTALNFGISPAGADQTFTEPATVALVPEPTTAALVGFGLLGLAAARRSRG